MVEKQNDNNYHIEYEVTICIINKSNKTQVNKLYGVFF